MTPLGEAGERPYQRGGQIVCHCERVTVGGGRAARAQPRCRRSTSTGCVAARGPSPAAARASTARPNCATLTGLERRPVSCSDRRVAIVGGGPAGLSAAIELRRLGVQHVTVHEREQHAGGIPRHTNHLGFGVRDLHRMMAGPRYARTLIDRARGRGCRAAGRRPPVFSLDDLDADAVILATGRSRAAAQCSAGARRPAGRDLHHRLGAATGDGRAARRLAGGDRRRRARQLLGDPHPRPCAAADRWRWSRRSPATSRTAWSSWRPRRCGAFRF